MTMTKKQFLYEYEQDVRNRLTFDYSPEADEKLKTSANGNESVLYLNRPGMLTLARTLIKIAEGDYQAGFHIHLRQDFNADLPECLTVILSPDDAPPH
jgi:hypothetical protein